MEDWRWSKDVCGFGGIWVICDDWLGRASVALGWDL